MKVHQPELWKDAIIVCEGKKICTGTTINLEIFEVMFSDPIENEAAPSIQRANL
jgi:hypothetical protein